MSDALCDHLRQSDFGHLSLMEEGCVKGLPILPVGFFYLVPETAGTNSIAS